MESENTLEELLDKFQSIVTAYMMLPQKYTLEDVGEVKKAILELFAQSQQDLDDIYNDFCISVHTDKVFADKYGIQLDWKELLTEAEELLIREAAPPLERTLQQKRHDREALIELRRREDDWINLNLAYRLHINRLQKRLEKLGFGSKTPHLDNIAAFQNKLGVGPSILKETNEPSNQSDVS